MVKRHLWQCRTACTAVVLILLGTGGARAAAQEHGEDQHAEAEAAQHEEHQEHQEHEFHRHHLSVFLGATTGEVEKHGGHGEAGTQSEGGGDTGETETRTEASVGVDYEYRLSRVWGIGFLFDYVGGGARASVAGIPIFLHPIGGLKLLAAPGLEHHEGENEFLVRLGLGYQFDLGRWGFTPGASIDFVGSDRVYIYGLYIGRGF